MPLLLLMLGRAVFASQTLSILRAQPCCLLPTDGASEALHCPPVETQTSFEVISVQTWLDLMVLFGFWRDTSWSLRWIFLLLQESSPIFFTKNHGVSMMSLSVGRRGGTINADFAKYLGTVMVPRLPQCSWWQKQPFSEFYSKSQCRQMSVDLTMRWSWSENQDFLSYTTHISPDASHLKVITRSETGFFCAHARSDDKLFLINIKTMSMGSFFKLVQL